MAVCLLLAQLRYKRTRSVYSKCGAARRGAGRCGMAAVRYGVSASAVQRSSEVWRRDRCRVAVIGTGVGAVLPCRCVVSLCRVVVL